MPANLTPQYIEAEHRFRAAKTPAEKTACLEEMLRVIPKHKGTDKMRADLRRRLSKLKSDPNKAGSAHRGYGVQVDKEGAGQIVILGAPNVGKSALLNALTKANPEVANYPFTTRKPMPGMVTFENVQVQLVDLPPLSRDYMESWMAQIARNTNALLLMVDLSNADVLEEMELLTDVLKEWKILPTQRRFTPEECEDLPTGVVPLRALLVGNKCDLQESEARWEVLHELYGDHWPMLEVAVTTGYHLETLSRELYALLDVVRVYTKAPGKKPDLSAPFTLPCGSTVAAVAATVHKDFAARLKFARIWSAKKYDGQMVPRDYVVHEEDVIELHT
ncbi:GTPase Obg [Candidatus Entotheonellaceae bacterium PAL068K]